MQNIAALDGIIKLLNKLFTNDSGYLKVYQYNNNLELVPDLMNGSLEFLSNKSFELMNKMTLSFNRQQATKFCQKNKTCETNKVEESWTKTHDYIIGFLESIKNAFKFEGELPQDFVNDDSSFKMQFDVVETSVILKKPKNIAVSAISPVSQDLTLDESSNKQTTVLLTIYNMQNDASLSMILIKKDKNVVRPKHKYLVIYIKQTEISESKKVAETEENKKVLSLNELSEKYKNDNFDIEQLKPITVPKLLDNIRVSSIANHKTCAIF